MAEAAQKRDMHINAEPYQAPPSTYTQGGDTNSSKSCACSAGALEPCLSDPTNAPPCLVPSSTEPGSPQKHGVLVTMVDTSALTRPKGLCKAAH
ncbi:hypothetical protein NDU88_008170 [Pleurodeles waltl]|uniref:Uncharacterized protein n=1 Tax=Pleurodeles waltl TaxID=8319 RepID=A0AAV7N814_PLEWA|nr:hypothetical protein NDU88_008170 [Pleurodeles waltl]